MATVNFASANYKDRYPAPKHRLRTAPSKANVASCTLYPYASLSQRERILMMQLQAANTALNVKEAEIAALKEEVSVCRKQLGGSGEQQQLRMGCDMKFQVQQLMLELESAQRRIAAEAEAHRAAEVEARRATEAAARRTAEAEALKAAEAEARKLAEWLRQTMLDMAARHQESEKEVWAKARAYVNEEKVKNMSFCSDMDNFGEAFHVAANKWYMPLTQPRFLGQGSYGTVVSARHKITRQGVAVKLACQDDNLDDPMMNVRCLENEFQNNLVLAGKTGNGGLAPGLLADFVMFETSDGRVWGAMATELAERDLFTELTTLAEQAEQNPSDLSPRRQILFWYHKLAELVGKMHKLHVIHGDIKPENLLCMRDPSNGEWTLKLCDLAGLKVEEDQCAFAEGSDSTLKPLWRLGFMPMTHIYAKPRGDWFSPTMVDLTFDQFSVFMIMWMALGLHGHVQDIKEIHRQVLWSRDNGLMLEGRQFSLSEYIKAVLGARAYTEEVAIAIAELMVSTLRATRL